MNYFHAVILGLVQGLTEFLPVSSTGHLILASRAMGLISTEFLKSFEIIIQLGSILAVVVYFYQRLMNSLPLLTKVFFAFLPTAILGLALYKIVKKYFIGNIHVVEIALASGGILLIILELLNRRSKSSIEDPVEMSWRQACLIGCFQALAFIPGVSRSGATILGGLSLGLSRSCIVEFSFLLAIPTMIAATGLDLIKSAHTFSMDQIGLLSVGFLTAFIVSLASIRFLLNYVKKHSFMVFGFYRIAIAAVFFLWFH